MAEQVYGAIGLAVTCGALVTLVATIIGVTRLQGIRPNQPRSRAALVPSCRHSSPPVPVEVHDRLDGRPETVAWLCPDCYGTTRPPPPPPRETTVYDGNGIVVQSWGVTAAEAAANLQRALRRC